jgi:hypothetical protein
LNLNLLFDEIVFENLTHLANRVVSPRKLGNMNCLSGKSYIGIKPPMKLSRREVSRWLKDPKFAADHQNWEDSVYQLIEKRLQRRGQGEKTKCEDAQWSR